MEARHLFKVGFSQRQADLLLNNPAPTFRQLCQAGFSTHQARALLRTDQSTEMLIWGGFTAAQAELLKEL